MKVVVEARALVAPSGGVRTYVQELVRGLTSLSVTVLRGSERVKGEFMILPWLNFLVPRELSRLKPNVVHFTKAAVPWRKLYPTVVTIYDIIPILLPRSQKLGARLYWPGTLRQAATTSDHVCTISETSKRDLVDRFQLDPKKITVTPLAVDTNHFCLTVDAGGDDIPYILYVGTIEPRKNVPLLVRAFARIANQLPHRLVIAGRFYKGRSDVQAEIDRVNLQDRVQLLGFVPYEALPLLYAKADLFVWPAVYEGWGLPPMEAMACGTPVVVSDGGSLPEVVGDTQEIVRFTTSDLNARLHDVDFERDLAQRILAVLGDAARRSVMRERGMTRVAQFSWHDVVSKTVEVYRTVCG